MEQGKYPTIKQEWEPNTDVDPLSTNVDLSKIKEELLDSETITNLNSASHKLKEEISIDEDNGQEETTER
ncbi:hypothetical protein C0J52_02069 [Blattella germanica]|nr:hypothetical protein C0J52_02069 [Blattella germanica]